VARIVPEAVRAGIGIYALAVAHIHLHDGSEVQLPVHKRTFVDVAAARAGRGVDGGRVVDGDWKWLEGAVAVGDIAAIARNRGRGTIVQRVGFGWEVWLVARVATLVAEGGFEELDKVPMPSEEETGGVDQWGVDDVCRFEVVESRNGRQGPWRDRSWTAWSGDI